jgi:hypothetical protein
MDWGRPPTYQPLVKYKKLKRAQKLTTVLLKYIGHGQFKPTLKLNELLGDIERVLGKPCTVISATRRCTIQ